MSIKIEEGQVFKIPLNERVQAIGVIARVHRKKRGKPVLVFAYFFGPYSGAIDVKLEQLDSRHAVMRLQCSILQLLSNSWPIIGEIPNWRREDWPLPIFFRNDLLRGTVLIRYDDNLDEIEQIPYVGGDFPLTDEQIFSGSEAVEIRLRQKLNISE
jgi:hypothetical protein